MRFGPPGDGGDRPCGNALASQPEGWPANHDERNAAPALRFCESATAAVAPCSTTAVVGIPTECDSELLVIPNEDERVPEDVEIPRAADLLWPALKQ